MNKPTEKHVEVWSWYMTKDRLTWLRVATDYKNPETGQQFYMIQEYRNCLIMSHGLTRGAARRFILENCIVQGE